MKKIYREPCSKFRKELKEFLRLKWNTAKPDLIQMIEQDIELFFEKYHRENGCFYREGK